MEQKAVELCLRQRVGSLLFQRILRGQHDEGRGYQMDFATHGHLPFLHCFEHGSLCFRWRAIDFISEDKIREYWTGKEVIGTFVGEGVFLNDLCSGHIAWHQVGSELDPFECQIERLGQRADEQCFGQARDAFQQRVPASEHGHQYLFHHFILPDNHFGKLFADLLITVMAVLDGCQFIWR